MVHAPTTRRSRTAERQREWRRRWASSLLDMPAPRYAGFEGVGILDNFVIRNAP
jgi:hypothetical protein